MTLPRIVITLGDPGGVGPEVVLKALHSTSSLPPAQYVLFGSEFVLRSEKRALGLEIEFQPWNREAPDGEPGFFFQEVGPLLKRLRRGRPYPENGKASFLYFQQAWEEAREGKLSALVTAPISKKSWAMAGVKWRGHTEFFNRFYPRAVMAFWSAPLKVALLTHHLPLREALRSVKEKNLTDFLTFLRGFFERSGLRGYEFLVSGLNPHAGEAGLLGTEEQSEIIPAILQARKEGMRISGPFPPDVVFRSALGYPKKVVIALYHDQGLIAFKIAAFETGVNITLGMPFIRTSPDHGTAFDIAGRGKANPQSMVEAIQLACRFSRAPAGEPASISSSS